MSARSGPAALTSRARWSNLPVVLRLAIGAAALFVAVGVGLSVLDSATRGADPHGPRSSSFSTADDGTAAFADLLRRYGHGVTRLRGELTGAELRDDATLMVLDAGPPTGREARAVARFVDGGGRVVVAGRDAGAWIEDTGIRPPRWIAGGSDVTRARIDGQRLTLRTDGHGRWARGSESTLVVQPRVTPGSAVLVADASPLHNDLVARADNAAFGLALAGDGSVAFVEGPHGYGDASGLGAVPERWRIALIGLALAGLLTAIAAGRRIGPPEDSARRLPPPRRAYVDALGASLRRARRPEAALAPMQEAARARLAERVGLPADAAADDLRARAARIGWTDAEIDAIFTPPHRRDDVLAVGRALAKASTGERADP